MGKACRSIVTSDAQSPCELYPLDKLRSRTGWSSLHKPRSSNEEKQPGWERLTLESLGSLQRLAPVTRDGLEMLPRLAKVTQLESSPGL